MRAATGSALFPPPAGSGGGARPPWPGRQGHIRRLGIEGRGAQKYLSTKLLKAKQYDRSCLSILGILTLLRDLILFEQNYEKLSRPNRVR